MTFEIPPLTLRHCGNAGDQVCAVWSVSWGRAGSNVLYRPRGRSETGTNSGRDSANVTPLERSTFGAITANAQVPRQRARKNPLLTSFSEIPKGSKVNYARSGVDKTSVSLEPSGVGSNHTDPPKGAGLRPWEP